MTGYLSDVWRLRHFWLALVRIDLRKRYRRSVLGMGWSLLQPIAMMVVLCAVFSQILNVSVREYAPLLLSGLTFWAFVMAVVLQGCQCFIMGESYIRQHPAPLAIYPLRTTLAAAFHFVIGFAITLAFVWWLNGFGNLPALVSLLPTFLLLFVFGWALAVCMGVSNVLFQDSQHLIEVFMQIMFYLTPIMYKPEMLLHKLDRRELAWVMDLNPFAVFLEMIRKPLLEGQLPPPSTMYHCVLFTTLALLIAGLALKRFEKKMIFYL